MWPSSNTFSCHVVKFVCEYPSGERDIYSVDIESLAADQKESI